MALFNVLVDFAARTSRLETGINRVEKRVGGFSNQISKFSRDAKRAFAAIGVGLSVREITQFSQKIVEANNQLKLLDVRLRTFSGSISGFARASEISNRLGISLEDAAGGMTRLLVVGREIGVTADEAQRLTTTFQQLARLGGSSGAEASNAFIQLTQALGAGVLRGQELNSILEGAPLVAQAIAKELSVSVGELKKLGEEGKITAQIVRDALAGAAEQANVQFAKLPETLEQQRTRVANAWRLLLAGLDESLRQSEIWKFFTSRLSEGLENLGQRLLPAELLNSGQVDEEIRRLETSADTLRKTIEVLAKQRAVFGGSATFGENRARSKLLEIETRLAELRERGSALNFDAIEQETAVTATVEKRLSYTQQLAALVEKIRNDNATIISQDAARADRPLTGFSVGSNDNAILRAMADIRKQTVEVKTDFKLAIDEMSVYAEQGARNMQSALADFLFDPFKDGLDGMLKGFVDVIRRMIAEAAAARLLGGASGFLGGLLGGIFGGASAASGSSGGFFKAAGGPVSGGRPYVVGERGPELFVPGASGSIVPNNKLASGGSFTYSPTLNFASGVDKDLRAALPGILAADRREAFRQWQSAMSRSGFAQPVM